MLWERHLCRLCACVKNFTYKILDKADDSYIEQKMKSLLNIDFFQEDLKPKVICRTCYDKLNEFYDFYNLCHASNSKFEEMMSQSKSLSEDAHNFCSSGYSTFHYDNVGLSDDKQLNSNTSYNFLHDKHSINSSSRVQCCEEATTVLRHSSQFSEPNEIVYTSLNVLCNNNSDAAIVKEIEMININQLNNLSTKSVIIKDGQKTNGNEETPQDPKKVNEALENIKFPVTKEDNNKKFKAKRDLISIETIQKNIQNIVGINQVNTDKECVAKENKIQEVDRKPFSCSVCQKFFSRKVNLNAHMALHTNHRPHVCCVCKKSFALKWELTTHKKVHSDLYKCTFCSKTFPANSKLERHLRIHTKSRPFTCSEEGCGKKFSDKRNLDSHMLVHNEIRNFKCEICQKCYKTKSQLKDHLRIHSKEEPFKCDLCSKTYRWKTNLTLHLMKHNGYRCLRCNKDCEKLTHFTKHRKECKDDQINVIT